MATCSLCGARYPDQDMLSHIEAAHPALAADATLERWPDGTPVIIDNTLKPEDFEPPADR